MAKLLIRKAREKIQENNRSADIGGMGIRAKNDFQKKMFGGTSKETNCNDSSRKMLHNKISNNKRPSEKVLMIDPHVIKEQKSLISSI